MLFAAADWEFSYAVREAMEEAASARDEVRTDIRCCETGQDPRVRKESDGAEESIVLPASMLICRGAQTQPPPPRAPRLPPRRARPKRPKQNGHTPLLAAAGSSDHPDATDGKEGLVAALLEKTPHGDVDAREYGVRII